MSKVHFSNFSLFRGYWEAIGRNSGVILSEKCITSLWKGYLFIDDVTLNWQPFINHFKRMKHSGYTISVTKEMMHEFESIKNIKIGCSHG